MAEVFLIIGRICSGKSYFAKKLKAERNAVIVSVDEITLALSDTLKDEAFDDATALLRKLLLNKAAEIAAAGANVILDWGFWTRSSREEAKRFFADKSLECRLFYIAADESAIKINIAERNSATTSGKTSDYYVDEGLAEKCGKAFEVPEKDESAEIIRVNR